MEIMLGVYALCGIVAGLLAGMLGVGGGIVIVPMLVFAFNWQGMPQDVAMLMALGTSMASIMFTSISSTLAHQRRGSVAWNIVLATAPGIVAGTYGGSFLAALIPPHFLKIVFIVFLFYVSTQMITGKKPAPSRHLPGTPGLVAAGGVIGLMSSLVGIGGGTLSVPFMTMHNVEMRKAVGTSAAIGFPIAVAGAAGYTVNGWNAANLPAYTFGYLYLPALAGLVSMSILTAPFGAKLAHSLPVAKLKKYFAALLIIVAVRMLTSIV